MKRRPWFFSRLLSSLFFPFPVSFIPIFPYLSVFFLFLCSCRYGSDELLEATDPLFSVIGAKFNKMTLEDFGDPTGLETPVFNADMYNEMDPNSADPTYGALAVVLVALVLGLVVVVFGG